MLRPPAIFWFVTRRLFGSALLSLIITSMATMALANGQIRTLESLSGEGVAITAVALSFTKWIVGPLNADFGNYSVEFGTRS